MEFDYNSPRWKRKSKHIMRLDGWKDRYQQRLGKAWEAKVVHHIYPVREFPEYAWEDWNLISVSLATHNMLENRVTGQLTKKGEELKDRTKPFVDWRRPHGSR